jgi:hypothetical protein
MEVLIEDGRRNRTKSGILAASIDAELKMGKGTRSQLGEEKVERLGTLALEYIRFGEGEFLSHHSPPNR